VTVVTTICFRAGHAAQAYEEDGTAALSPIPLFAVEPSRGTLCHRSPAKRVSHCRHIISSASSSGGASCCERNVRPPSAEGIDGLVIAITSRSPPRP
jgi:hypothetical protein